MFPLFCVALTFLVGLVMLARRSAGSSRAPQLVLGVLPLALLFVPVQLLGDIWQLMATFKTIASTQTGSSRALVALSLEHHRSFSLVSWLVVAAVVLACLAQSLGLRFGAPRTSARTADDRAGWGDWSLAICPVMVLAVGIVALSAQRIEARVMGFLAATSGVEPPPHVESWVAGFGAERLGEVIGTDAVLAMFGAVMTICTLIAFAAANTFMRRGEPWRWLTAYAWAVTGVTCGLAAINALRVNAAVDWAERVLPLVRDT